MANKTNKSYAKRITITKNGKLKVRANNRCHYNSGENNASKMKKKRSLNFSMPAKMLTRMMPFAKK